MPSRRRRQVELERVLGTPALFATAYGNVGSSIYYALGLTAVYALGLTPLVFVVAGVIFACHRGDLRRGHGALPGGGRLLQLRPARLQRARLLRGGAGRRCSSTSSRSRRPAFFVPHYLSIFWEPLRENPWDIVGGVVVIVVLVVLNIVGVQEAARLSITLAVIDFATQVLLVAARLRARLQPARSSSTTSTGASRRPGRTSRSRSRSRCSPTPGSRPSRTSPRRCATRSGTCRARTGSSRYAVFAIYFTLPLDRALGAAGRGDRRRADDAARAAAGGGRLRERPDPRRRPEPRRRGRAARRARDLRRRARGDDPLHRHERRRDRRLADHVRDGDLPADPGGLPAAAPALQDAVALDRRSSPASLPIS